MAEAQRQPTAEDYLKALYERQEQMGQELAQTRAQLAQALQQRQQPAAPQPKAPAPSELEAANQSLREVMIDNPLRFTNELLATARSQAVAEVRQEMDDKLSAREQRAYVQDIERQTMQANPDLRGFERLIGEAIERMDPNRPMLDRVVEAVKVTRGRLAERDKAIVENVKREIASGIEGGMPQGGGYDATPPANARQPSHMEAARERFAIMREGNMRPRTLRAPKAAAQ